MLREGLPEDRVIKTGSPMKEVLDHHAAKIRSSDILSRLGLERERYFVVSIHREENVDQPENLSALAQALGSLAEEFQLPMIVSLHPRTRKRLEAGGHTLHPLLRTMPPLPVVWAAALGHGHPPSRLRGRSKSKPKPRTS